MPQKPKSTDKAEQKTPVASDNPTRKWWKNRWFIIGASTLFVVIAGTVAYFFLIQDDSGEETTSEELSYAEELESFTVAEEADQETINSVMLNKAWAHYEEQNYDRALERLGQIQEPSEDIQTSMYRLYGHIYEGQGDTQKANEYYQQSLSTQEQELLDAAEESPDIYFSLAILYEEAGRNVDAKKYYQFYIDEFDPGDTPLEEIALDENILMNLETAKQKVDSL